MSFHKSSTGLSTGTLGAMSEMVAIADLMKRGYHVFRAQSPSCPCDLVIFKDNQVCLRVEVRTINGERGTYSNGKIANMHYKDNGIIDIWAFVWVNGKVEYHGPPKVGIDSNNDYPI